MGWSIGYDSKWKRDIGYGVPAICDHPGCDEEINRGLSYVCCGQQPYGGEDGCGLYFCNAHKNYGPSEDIISPAKCDRCLESREPFDPKPDTQEWIDWKETDPSWQAWRDERDAKLETIKEGN